VSIHRIADVYVRLTAPWRRLAWAWQNAVAYYRYHHPNDPSRGLSPRPHPEGRIR